MIFWELFFTFLKIGAFTFGGGYAMLPLIQEEVIRHNWLENEALVDFVAVSESTPGPFAVNIATYVGSETGGVLGAFCATLGVVLPSFLIILIVAKCFEAFKENKVVKGCMSGLKPAVIGLIGSAVISVGQTVFLTATEAGHWIFDEHFLISVAIFIAALVAALKKAHPILIILGSAVAGILAGIFFLN